MLDARIRTLREQGGNPFAQLQIPQAAIALKQGAGRLIRDIHDRGVLMFGDPRLVTLGYGRIFVDSLPPMPRTRELADVQARHGGSDCVQLAANLGGRIGLGVPGVVLRRPAGEEQQQTSLGPAEAGLGRTGMVGGTQQRRQRQLHPAERPQPQHIPPADPVAEALCRAANG